MDRTVPEAAAFLLDFIASKEAPKGYDTVFGNRMSQMPKPLTTMTIAEVIMDGSRRTKLFGSSACGRYQFMTATLKGLYTELGLRDGQVFDPGLQDRLGYHLLKRRGFGTYMRGTISAVEFGKRLAQEWASFPVLAATQGAHRALKRGDSYYRGDGVNAALVDPDTVEMMLMKALSLPVVAPTPTAGSPAGPVEAPKPAVLLPVPDPPPPAVPPGWLHRIGAAIDRFFGA